MKLATPDPVQTAQQIFFGLTDMIEDVRMRYYRSHGADSTHLFISGDTHSILVATVEIALGPLKKGSKADGERGFRIGGMRLVIDARMSGVSCRSPGGDS